MRARESVTLRSKNTYQYLFCLLMVEFMKIQYKCLVPIEVFPEIKLRGLVISKTEYNIFQFSHSCICERFIYPHDWSAEDRSWEYINRSQIHKCRNL